LGICCFYLKLFLGFIGFLMVVQPILGNSLGIVWEAVGNPVDVLGSFLGFIKVLMEISWAFVWVS
jgi:hypothetical protein